MNNERVKELLTNYRSYKYAVSNGIAPFVEDDTLGMPMALDFGSRPPRGLTGRGTLTASLRDYQQYSRVVRLIEGAVQDVLDDKERRVIELKYLERNTYTLYKIGEIVGYNERHIRRLHKTALKKLSTALVMVQAPEIINLDKVLA